jgi:hypothetical protein
MQRGTKGGRAGCFMSHDALLKLLGQLASADLAGFAGLCKQLTGAFPTLFAAEHDLPGLDQSIGCDFSSLDLNRALIAASSRGLGLIAPLFRGSSTISIYSKDALQCVLACVTLCSKCMVRYPSASSGDLLVKSPSDNRCKQVELAVAVSSSGEQLLQFLMKSCKQATMFHTVMVGYMVGYTMQLCSSSRTSVNIFLQAAACDAGVKGTR